MPRRKRRAGFQVIAIAAATLAVPLATAGTASADRVIDSGHLLSTVKAPDGSYVEKVEVQDKQNLTIYVHSAAMNETVPLLVQRPADTGVPRPTLYLLNGAGGGEDAATWKAKTDAYDFLASKNINVVSPVGGKWSYYTDWKQADPALGLNKWKTFLMSEVPPIVNAGLGTNGQNAIAGLSSSGTSVLQLAEAQPGFYKSVAAYSGCAQISDPIGQQFVKMVVETYGGGNVENMYGPPNDPMWAANDPYVNAEKLRGTALYISDGNGLPGPWDTLDGPRALPGPDGLANQVVVGGVIEAAVNYCSHNLQGKLGQLGIPATYNFRDSGTHSWGYWQDALKNSWPVLAGPLGI